MTIATTQANHSSNSPIFDQLGNLALSPSPAFLDEAVPGDLNKALRISGILQTSLDLARTIEIFALEISRWIKFDQLRYHHAEQSIDMRLGRGGRHLCHYRLVVSGQALGELEVRRKTPFNTEENTLLESLLCGLIYPLRNALAYKEATDAALKDPLTGVGNRAALDACLAREVDLSHRHANPLSLLALDIDLFKKVNDNHGHSIGDCVIKAVADAARTTIRRSDVIFRYGGEEFVVVLSNTHETGALRLAERLRQNIEQTSIICDDVCLSATVSIGIASAVDDDSPETLFERADKALYEAKASGRNCCKVHPSISGEVPA